MGLVRGTSALLTRELVESAALIGAAYSVGGAKVPGPSFAVSAEFERALGRLPRKVKKELTQLLSESSAEPPVDVLAWSQAARATLDRAAAVMLGDVSWVVLKLEERLASDRKLDPAYEHRLWPLLRFVLSPTFLELRAQLGMAAR